MHSKAVEEELIDLERRYWKALEKREVKVAVALTDFPCIITGPQGVGRVDAGTFATMVKDHRYTIERAELKDAEVRMLRDDVAVVAYKVHEELTVEGRPVALDAADSSIWIRRNGHWACAMHSEAIAGDPFGRDRAASGL